MIDMRTLQLIRGIYKTRHVSEALAWARVADNPTLLEAAWKKLNEHD